MRRTAATAAGAPRLTEAQFQAQVVSLAAILGFEQLHLRPAMTAKGYRVAISGTLGAGWPDLTLVRERDARLLFVELKSAVGKLSLDQIRVLWRPADMEDGTISAVLMHREEEVSRG